MSTTANSGLYTELRKRQRAIEGRIARYRAKIADSERELEECLEMLQLFPRTYPVLTLPNEITTEIFLYSNLPSLMGRESTPNPHYAPMLLLHVCRAWRAIAIATPRLWANLWLDFSCLPSRFFEAENLDKFLAEYVVRLGACPLSLKLTGYFQSEEIEDDGKRLVASIFHQLSSRLEVLNLVTEIDYYREHHSHFPLLRKLTVGFPHYTDESDLIGLDERPIQTFSAAPQRQLYLFNKAIPSHFAILWETLTVFTGEELLSRDCVEVLRLAPSITKCIFESEINMHADFPTLTHPNLKSTNGSEALIRFVTFPALQDLEVYADDMNDVQLLKFISRSASTLLKLSTTDVSLQSLHAMSILTHLHLYAPNSNYLSGPSGFLTMLNRTLNPGFLPQLQTLEFEDCKPFVNVHFANVLSSRAVAQDGAAKLRSFRQIWSRSQFHALRVDYTEYIAYLFEELAEDGMEIYIGLPRRYVSSIALISIPVGNHCGYKLFSFSQSFPFQLA
ncbi:F-box domain-containing protein [Mycena sanguinolenta]|uniref:F-box domain-containing protein n=1 Tax=Mycena sanguinolenta TaxID=230812 RepID=A0A8H7CH58_9AGAR|nr:F-box domain-containing protein [Mycena sanguinolenta]